MIDKLLKEQKKLSQNKRWKAALEINEKLIGLAPSNPDAFRERSRYFRRLGDLENATQAMATHLELVCDTSMDELLGEINSDLKKSLGLKTLLSSFKVTASGGFNFGIIEHASDRGDVLFTKIATSKVGNNECIFYREIREKFESIKNISPELLHSMETYKGNISLLTFQKIPGGHASLENNKDMVFSAYKALVEIKSNEIEDIIEFSNPKIRIGRELKLSRIFSQISDEKVVKSLFVWIDDKLRRLDLGIDIAQEFMSLKNVMEENGCFSELNKRYDYSLMHGDFHQGNMLLSQDRKKIFLIDWPNLCIAPKGADLSKMFRREKWNFNRIYVDFLCNQDMNADMNIPEKILFVFFMILTWLNFMPRKALADYENYIGPAIKYICARVK